ncbi:hypothetical protein CORC01_00063, partial [Colletotrichum orchidophilum]
NELDKYINNKFKKGYIKLLSFLIKILIFFIFKKSKKKLRFIINYKTLNKIIKKNYYLLFFIIKFKEMLYRA